MTMLNGDCLPLMADMGSDAFDAVVTDPPYGLKFMGKAWDHGAPGVPFWAEMLRVAKPGAYLLAFGGTRTVHRQMVAIEDAGWIIRDLLVWAYATGFPKSRALLKPAWEPIVMARKPGPLRHLNIDAGRIGTGEDVPEFERLGRKSAGIYGDGLNGSRRVRRGEASAERRYGGKGATDLNPLPGPRGGASIGRWPSNVILTDPIFDGGVSGVIGGGPHQANTSTSRGDIGTQGILSPAKGYGPVPVPGIWYGDGGTYSKFFLIPKADKGEREPVGEIIGELRREDAETVRRNTHPTVKPLELMCHLVRLVTPVGGSVLDPFAGSGTTAIACEMEGFDWVAIEKEREYYRIALARLEGVQRGLGLGA